MALVILEIPGVKGESSVEKYERMILCDSFSQDCELEIEPTQNARRTIHVPKINNLSLERKMDAATPFILRKMLTAKVDDQKWKIHCLKGLGVDGSMQVEFMTIELKHPILSKHTMSVNEGDTTETLEINAVEITWTYIPYSENQKGQGQIPVTFDTLKGKVV